MQIHTGEESICGNNLHICVYGYEVKKKMSPIAHCVYILKISVINACLARRFLKSTCETVSPARRSHLVVFYIKECH